MKTWILLLILVTTGLFHNVNQLYAGSKFPNQRSNPVTFGLGLEYIWAKADGKGRYTSNSIKGSKFSYGDLDLDTDNIGIPVFDFYFGTRVHQLHFEYTQFSLSGADNINQNLTIHSQAYAIGDYLSTDLETKWGRMYYEFFDVGNGYSYGILLGVEDYIFNYDILDEKTNSHNTFSMNKINPLLGTHVSMNKGSWALKLSAFYIPNLFGILKYNTLDLSAAAAFTFGNYMEIEGGYRFVNSVIDGSSNEDQNGIKIKGIFATIRIKY